MTDPAPQRYVCIAFSFQVFLKTRSLDNIFGFQIKTKIDLASYRTLKSQGDMFSGPVSSYLGDIWMVLPMCFTMFLSNVNFSCHLAVQPNNAFESIRNSH